MIVRAHIGSGLARHEAIAAFLLFKPSTDI